jgi:dual specificity MAP kinase phosphatase
MYTRHLSLIDAYLTLHLEVHRSFFVYQFDLPFLQTIEKQIIELRGKPKKLASRPTSPMAKWNPFSSGFPRNPNSTETRETSHVQPFRKRSSNKFDNPKLGNDDWMSFPRFDGSLPSRIQDHLYLGNLYVILLD